MNKCPLTKDAHVEDAPCDLCALIQKLGELVSKASKEVKELEPIKQFNRMKAGYNELNKTHKRCAGCGLCFGGSHIAFPYFVNGIGRVCQWCSQDIDKKGIEAFKKSMKRQNEKELEEEA